MLRIDFPRIPVRPPLVPPEGPSYDQSYVGLSSYKSTNFVGMPPLGLCSVGENVFRDTKYGNPLGDVVDNSAGVNNVKKTSTGPVKTELNRGGIYLRMHSAPSWLYKDF